MVGHLPSSDHDHEEEETFSGLRRDSARFAEDRKITTTLLNVAGVMERADEQVLPAVFKFVGAAYSATPSQLGTLTFMRAIVQALSSPFSGILGDFIDRRLIVGVGAIWWGFWTILISGNGSYEGAMFLWAMNGLGLAAIIPSSQSLIADYYRASQRGEAFGLLAMTGAIGALLAGLFATNVGGKSIGGLDGWRFAFLMIGVVSFTVGVLVLLFVKDPRRNQLLDGKEILQILALSWRALLEKIKLKIGLAKASRYRPWTPAAPVTAVPVSPHTTTLFASVSYSDHHHVQPLRTANSHSPDTTTHAAPHSSPPPGASASHHKTFKPLTPLQAQQLHAGGGEAVLILSAASDEPVAPKASSSPARQRVTWKDIKWLLGIPSFQIIIAQGVAGSTPWNALVFFTLWLQLLGMTDFQASIVMATFALGNSIGNLLGGILGDWMSRRWPNHGRIVTAQTTVFLGIPFAYIFLKCLPQEEVQRGSVFATYIVVALLFGGVASWAATACNSPMFAEIVPSRLRSSIYSYDRCFESALAACAAPIVGIIAERVFDFKGDLSEASRTGPDLQRFRRRNADALGKALLLCMEVPWVICLLFYSFLHFTYKKDRQNMVQHVVAETAAARIELSPYASPNPSPAPNLEEALAAAGPSNSTKLTLVLENGECVQVDEYLGIAKPPGLYRDSVLPGDSAKN